MITLEQAKELGYSWKPHTDEPHTLEVFKDDEPAFQVSSDRPLFSLLVEFNETLEGGDPTIRSFTDEQVKELTGE